ncbi:hypothetical protein ACU6TU_12255 [Halomonas sp. LS-001]
MNTDPAQEPPTRPDTSSGKRRWPRWLGILSIVTLSLVAIWLAGTYWLLNSQWLPQQLSKLEGIEIRWDQGRSHHPGRWEVEGLMIAREEAALPLEVNAERATLTLSLLALLRGELHIVALEAEGIRHLQIGDMTLQGDGQLSLRDTTLNRDTLEIPQAGLQLQQGQVVRNSDGAIMARDIAIDASARLYSVTLTTPDGDLNPALAEALSGQARVSAIADAWDVFMPYLTSLPWLAVDGRGELDAQLSIQYGYLQTGSQLTLAAPALNVRVDEAALRDSNEQRWTRPDDRPPGHQARGDGMITLQVPDDDTLTLQVALDDVTIGETLTDADTPPYVNAAALTLDTSLDNARIDRVAAPEQARLTVRGQVLRLDMLERPLSSALAELLDERGLALSGNGEINADAMFSMDQVESATLEVTANALQASALGFTTRGEGTLNAQLSDPDTLSANLALRRARLEHQQRTLLEDAALTLNLDSPTDPQRAQQEANARLRFENATLPDIAALQSYLTPYLPTPSPLTLVSGQARSQGDLRLTPQRLSGAATLSGNAWVTDWRNATQTHRLTSNMQLDVALNEALLDGSALDLSGTRLQWRLGEASQDEQLESLLVLREGLFRQVDDTPSGRFTLEGSVQQLGFLNAFLPSAHGLSLSGGGQLLAEGQFQGNRLKAPTRLRVNASPLEVRFLDYEATGQGELTAQLSLKPSSDAESAQLTLSIPSFMLKRQGDPQADLEGRHLTLTTTTEVVAALIDNPDPRHITTRISLPVISVPDLSRYNDYLPEGAGVALHGGEASLSSELTLQGLNGSGNVTLRAFGAELTLLDQRLKGDLDVNFKLTEGDLENMRFKADDSFLRLENVLHLSEAGNQDAGWWAELGLEDATLVWDSPLTLNAEVNLALRDSGLLARLFLARARESDWLGRLLSVRDIDGHTSLTLEEKQLALNGLTLSGGPLMLLADLTLADSTANGALYAQLGQLGVGIELIDKEPTLKVLQPRRWFERWRTDHLLSR